MFQFFRDDVGLIDYVIQNLAITWLLLQDRQRFVEPIKQQAGTLDAFEPTFQLMVVHLDLSTYDAQ